MQFEQKVYNLLAGYEHNRADGWFFLAVAGRTPLKPGDLAKHWEVVRAGDFRIAYAQRPFSYHLCQGDESPPPYGCEWPRFKTPPGYYAFVGPTEQAIESQLCLALEQYRPKLEAEAILEKAIRVPDVAGQVTELNERTGMGSCPFHPPDRHPSFGVNRREQWWIDFHGRDGRGGPPVGGDAFELYCRLNGIGHREGIARLAYLL